MSRRIDIEITSISGQSATWRAAGARQPKGVLNTNLLVKNAKVGDTFRAEIEQFMEGVDVLSVAAPKAASPIDPNHERLAILVTEQKGPDVVVTYATKGRGSRDGARNHDDRPPRSGAPRERRKPEGDARSKGPSTRNDDTRAKRPSTRNDNTDKDRDSRSSNPRERTGPARTDATRSPGGARPTSDRRSPRSGSSPRPAGPAVPPMATIHRNAFLATLSPEQLPVAEQLLRGGMPAVRHAVADQNKNATSQGRTTIDPDLIDRIAVDLLGKANLANWKDRATGALGAGRELRLRDLRAVVTSAKTVSLDDDARVQHKELQASLITRVEALRVEWVAKLDRALANGDVLEALRLTIRTPEPSTRVSSDAAVKIAALASSALSAETPIATWTEIVNTTIDSPIRRLVKPMGIPSDVACQALALKSAGAIPEFAKLLGLKVPPPPPAPSRPARPTRRPPARPSTRPTS